VYQSLQQTVTSVAIDFYTSYGRLTTSTGVWKNIVSSPLFVGCTKNHKSHYTTISGPCIQSSPKLPPARGLLHSSRQTVPHTRSGDSEATVADSDTRAWHRYLGWMNRRRFCLRKGGRQEHICLITTMFCFNEFAFTVQLKHKINSVQIFGFILVSFYFTTGHFHTRVLCKECSIFLF